MGNSSEESVSVQHELRPKLGGLQDRLWEPDRRVLPRERQHPPSRRYACFVPRGIARGRQEAVRQVRELCSGRSGRQIPLEYGFVLGNLSNAIYGQHSHAQHIQRGMQFSTPDQDNDGCSCNCAFSSGWWMNWCGVANLNSRNAPSWIEDISSSNFLSATFTEMKIRPSGN